MVKIVLDTSVVIDHLRVGIGSFSQIVSLQKSQKAEVYVPTIVFFELWLGESMFDLKENERIRRLLVSIKAIDLTKQIAKEAGSLMRNRAMSDGFDAIIAATALHLNAELATKNGKHFQKVPELKLF